MLDYSELTVFKNADGIATALGYPINSFLMQNNKALFVGGGGKGKYANAIADENLAVPAGLVCMTETICRAPGADEMGAYEMGEGANAYDIEGAYADEMDVVPEGLYEQLLALAETKPSKKMTKRKLPHTKIKKHKKTHKRR